MTPERPPLKLRDDLVIVPRVERGESLYLYKVLETQSYYTIDAMQHEILILLDGTRSMEEVVADHNAKNAAMPIDMDFLEEYLDNLKEAEIFEKTAEEKKILFMEKVRNQRRQTASHKNIFGSIAEFKIAAWDPDRFLEKTLPYVRWIFTPGFILFSCLCMLVMLGIWIAHWERMMEGTVYLFTFQGKSGADIFQFFVLLFIISLIHECAHGLTCKYFGGEVRQMGFLLMFFTPCFFCDVSDAYMFDRHSKRQWVIFSGGYIELFISSLSTFVWALTAPGTLINDLAYKTLLLTGLTSVILQYNPLIKLDGYYSLMDFLEISDLWERSFAFVSNWFKKNIFRLPVEMETPPKKVRRIFCLYVLLSFSYKILLTYVFLVFFKNILFGLLGDYAYPVMAFVIFLAIRKPMSKLAGFLKFTILDKKEVFMKPRYLFLSVGGPILLVAGFTLLPVPVVFRGDFVLEPEAIAYARPSVDGTLERVLVTEGQEVREGEALALLRNDPVTKSLPVLQDKLNLCNHEIAEASNRGQRAVLAKKLEERKLILDQLNMLEEKTQALTLRSPIDGVVTTPRLQDQVGAYLAVGQTFCEVVGAEGLMARVPVREYEMSEIHAGQSVDLMVAPFPFKSFQATVVDLAPASESTEFREFTDFDVIVRIEGRPEELKSGMTGKARIHTGYSTMARRSGRAVRRWFESRVW